MLACSGMTCLFDHFTFVSSKTLLNYHSWIPSLLVTAFRNAASFHLKPTHSSLILFYHLKTILFLLPLTLPSLSHLIAIQPIISGLVLSLLSTLILLELASCQTQLMSLQFSCHFFLETLQLWHLQTLITPFYLCLHSMNKGKWRKSQGFLNPEK